MIATDLPIDSDGVYRLPPGITTLAEPLVIGTPGQLTTVRVRGSGRAPFGAWVPGSTVLQATHDGPAVKFVGARDSSISHCTLKGPYYDTLEWKPKGPKVEDWPASDRYNPAAGIGISEVSSGVRITNVDVAGFSVGVVLSPDGTDGQNEFVTLENSRMAFCTYGVSVSHTQNRQLKIEKCDFLDLHTAITNNTHGKQAGFLDAYINSNFNNVERLCDVNQGYAGVLTFQSCYGELIGTLGQFHDHAARMAVASAFRDCDWRIVGTGPLATGGQLLFDAGRVETPDIAVIGSSCEIRGTKFRPIWYEQ